MDTKHLAVDGYVDVLPTPGPRGTVAFELIVRPADADTAAPDTPDTVVVCSIGDPRITELLLTGIELSDLLRVTGTLVQPDDPALPGRLTVDALEVLAAAPIPVPRELVFDRYGQYAVIFNADRDAVPVFLASGEWVGEATSADLIGPADRRLGERRRPMTPAVPAQRTLLQRFPVGHPCGSRPPTSAPLFQRAQGIAARVVTDLAGDQFLMVDDTRPQ
ncbi:hypothetical protein ACGF5F_34660 [Streptomyces sp. NPDC047821]|uniref:hypothetical protein n=1 Tax=Streptomyces sp. NPDC047821 TaxID=3365488 RepID=UPI00372323B2